MEEEVNRESNAMVSGTNSDSGSSGETHCSLSVTGA